MNELLKAGLMVHFSDAQLTAFFGARSDSELETILDAMQKMTPSQVVRFKRQLGILYRRSHGLRQNNRKGTHSVMGTLIVEASKHERGDI